MDEKERAADGRAAAGGADSADSAAGLRSWRRIRRRLWADIREYWKFGAAFAAYDRLVMWLFGAFCPSVIVAGLPCPGCGMTRSVFCFATGQFEKGWQMNPMGILWLFLAIYFCIMRYGLGKKPAGVLQIGGCLVVMMAVLYLYRMYREFPGAEPLCYTPGNLLERLWLGYGSWILEKIGRWHV